MLNQKTNQNADKTGIDQLLFKQTMAHFATGICLVTCQNDSGQPAGLIVNSLASVSLNPPLISFCLAQSSQLHDVFAVSNYFSVNMLTADQEWVSKQFTSPIADRWDGVTHELSEIGQCPLINGTLAQMECIIETRHHAGDHTIYIGRVIHAASQNNGAPLVYYNRQYGEFSNSK